MKQLYEIEKIMEGDYYDYEKNLSTSFDSEQNIRARKRQRLHETNIAEVRRFPLHDNIPHHLESTKGSLVLNENVPSDESNPNLFNPQCRSESGQDSYTRAQVPHYIENTASNSHALDSPSNLSATHEIQYYSYDNHQHHPGQYLPVNWDPYSYQYHTQSWGSSTPSYHPSADNPAKETSYPHYGHGPDKEGQASDFFPHPNAPYPYYYHPNYHEQYQHQQCISSDHFISQPNRSYSNRDSFNVPFPRSGTTATNTNDMPMQRTMSLYMACDEDRLSEYQCLARKQIEVFSATYTDIKMTVQGRNRQILPGQVGIRCRYCSHIPIKKQARASVYYPSKLDCIYQAAQNMASVHLAKYCTYVPEEIRNDLLRHMKDRKSSAGGGKEYWAVSARSLGIEEFDGRLRFKSDTVSHKVQAQVNSPGGI